MIDTQTCLFTKTTFDNEYTTKPILKWAGGKRGLLPIIYKYMLPFYIECNRYVELFFGGGAVLFDLKPNKAVINDINFELINVYMSIRDNSSQLISLLQDHSHNHSTEYYYAVRNIDRDSQRYNKLSAVEKAARIIYLNKTCFNGLYRVNSKGHFNVPIGGYTNPNIVNESTILSISDYFNNNNILILNKDFEEIVNYIDKKDFIYVDPPYDIINPQSFVAYSVNGFNRIDQERLKTFCDKASVIGCKVMISNSYTDFIINLYKNYRIEIIDAPRFIGASSKSRGLVKEVLIMNF